MIAQSPLPTQPLATELLPFLGSDVAAAYEQAQVVILPIPYEATTTYRKGCAQGPASLLVASQQVEYYDEELEREVWPVGIYTHAAVGGDVPNAETMLQQVREAVKGCADDGKFVIGIGGEHSITSAIVEAYVQSNPSEPFTVVQIDAHGDLRHEYEGSIHNHACVMRRIVDMGLPTLQIGIRSICQEEADLIRTQNLAVFRARELAKSANWIDEALAAIPTRKVFITIDVDGLDPALMPGVGTPEPGGLGWYETLTFLRRLFEGHEVIGADVMELAPLGDSVVSEFTCAKLVYKLIGYHTLAANPS
ncbi:agmatinase [Leptolyngbya sp. FACHB-261]|uniref:agmatinase n=1 Tax=Leptolyngbya sp. FACHB-261 TaxID=2692806 RepID=UPI001681CF05|nr:agmatinase [Leptolyngbya sp. FACHB-261]MBD2104219.1 agmatinase [Leptolyngbya sp. FACHB-261]